MIKKSIEKIIDEYDVNDSCIMLYDLNKLKKNINNIIYLKAKYNVEFIFPVKSFPNSRVLEFFKRYSKSTKLSFCIKVSVYSHTIIIIFRNVF